MGTRLTGTAADLHVLYMCSRKHTCDRQRVLGLEHGCSLSEKIEQCPRRVRVGVMMRSYFSLCFVGGGVRESVNEEKQTTLHVL